MLKQRNVIAFRVADISSPVLAKPLRHLNPLNDGASRWGAECGQ